jgi:hypothetical protein
MHIELYLHSEDYVIYMKAIKINIAVLIN